MSAILTIAMKDLRIFARDRTNAFFVIVFPLAIAIFFGSIFGGSSRSIPVAVIVESAGPVATDFANTLQKDSTLSVVILPTREDWRSLHRYDTDRVKIEWQWQDKKDPIDYYPRNLVPKKGTKKKLADKKKADKLKADKKKGKVKK